MQWEERIAAYGKYLTEQEHSRATREKYLRDVRGFCEFLREDRLKKDRVLHYKEVLVGRYAAASVNAMLAAVNGFLAFIGRPDCRIRPVKTQRRAFLPRERELTKSDYHRLVAAAERMKNRRLCLLMQTICATGIRVSELRYVTAEAVRRGRAEVTCKGKTRTVFLPRALCRAITQYIKQRRITNGAVFVTRSGKPMNRSNIWREMKGLCKQAGVACGKVFPHNLRHLFARAYYAIDRDIAHLADLLGHSSIDTTRIYTMTSGAEQERRVAKLGLVLQL